MDLGKCFQNKVSGSCNHGYTHRCAILVFHIYLKLFFEVWRELGEDVMWIA